MRVFVGRATKFPKSECTSKRHVCILRALFCGLPKVFADIFLFLYHGSLTWQPLNSKNITQIFKGEPQQKYSIRYNDFHGSNKTSFILSIFFIFVLYFMSPFSDIFHVDSIIKHLFFLQKLNRYIIYTHSYKILGTMFQPFYFIFIFFLFHPEY